MRSIPYFWVSRQYGPTATRRQYTGHERDAGSGTTTGCIGSWTVCRGGGRVPTRTWEAPSGFSKRLSCVSGSLFTAEQVVQHYHGREWIPCGDAFPGRLIRAKCPSPERTLRRDRHTVPSGTPAAWRRGAAAI
ncbi:MAG: hypothetical protein NZ585_14305 [Chloracidobacterium sp.]|nr:hypothetical protein [Chloracidobacterium sp.]MDW8217890.1 hypothetical protein [Acidobacteriota bacterium]